MAIQLKNCNGKVQNTLKMNQLNYNKIPKHFQVENFENHSELQILK